MDKTLIAQLSGEIQQRVEKQMENGKLQRMQSFADEEQKMDTNRILAFVLAESKLFTTLYMTDFLMTLSEYEEMDQKLQDGTLEMPEAAEKTEESSEPQAE